MGIELRKGKLYLYDRERVNGRLRGVYRCPVSPESEPLFRELAQLARQRRQAARHEVEAVAKWATDLWRTGEMLNQLADRVFRASMLVAGYRLHKRWEWRRKRKGLPMTNANQLPAKPEKAMIRPASRDPEVQQLLDKAATGDESVLPAIRELFDEPNSHYRNNFGAVESWARDSLIRVAAGDNLAVREALRETLADYRKKLLEECGPNPTFSERMTATRIAHAWLAAHLLELKLAQYDATSKAADLLSKELCRAERRLHASLKALAVLRRLRTPVAVAVLHHCNPPRISTGVHLGKPNIPDAILLADAESGTRRDVGG